MAPGPFDILAIDRLIVLSVHPHIIVVLLVSLRISYTTGARIDTYK